MTLDEWIELSPVERNNHRRGWECNRGEWTDLLATAQARFETAYKSHLLVNLISRSGWHGTSNEPSILVTTALYTPQRIEELPDRFCTFRVVQEPVLDNRDHFLKVWSIVLNEMLGWDESRTLKWAERWDDELNGRKAASMFYHDDPYTRILPLIVAESVPPDSLRGYQDIELQNAVCRAIRSRGSEPIWLTPYDWDAARFRVNDLLGQIGGQLPRR